MTVFAKTNKCINKLPRGIQTAAAFFLVLARHLVVKLQTSSAVATRGGSLVSCMNDMNHFSRYYTLTVAHQGKLGCCALMYSVCNLNVFHLKKAGTWSS